MVKTGEAKRIIKPIICRLMFLLFHITDKNEGTRYSRLPLSRSQRDPLKQFDIFVLRHIRFAEELRKVPIKLPNLTNEHVI